jgi:beta-phosphoglucomutase-like phosphatase (HAD superfamily)
MSPQIKAVIFDCDGTLVDSEKSHLAAWQDVAKDFTVDFSREEYISFVGGSDTSVSKILAERIGHDNPFDLLDKKRKYFLSRLNEGLSPINPTVDFAKMLLETKDIHGLKIAVASAALKYEVLANIKNLGLEGAFDLVLSGHDDLTDYLDPEGVNKPKPYIYQHAAKLLGLDPKECVAIEDSFTGVTSGVSAGCFTIAIPNHFSMTHDLSKASLKLESLSGHTVESFLNLIKERN